MDFWMRLNNLTFILKKKNINLYNYVYKVKWYQNFVGFVLFIVRSYGFF